MLALFVPLLAALRFSIRSRLAPEAGMLALWHPLAVPPVGGLHHHGERRAA
jgi:hypothetical protein